MNRIEFSKTILPNLEWEDKESHLVTSLSDSNSFSKACSKLDNISSLEEADEDDKIDLEGISLTYKGFGDDDEIFTIIAKGDFIKDNYNIEIW